MMFISDHPMAGKNEAEIMENNLVEVKKCGVCGAENFKSIGVFRKDPMIHFVRCPQCYAVTYDRILSQDAIDEMYNEEQYYEDTNEDANVTFYGTERFAKHLFRYCRTIEPKKVIRILDFGGGDGSVSYRLSQLLCKKFANTRFEITVVDYTEKLYKKDDVRIKMFHSFPLENIASDEKYDILIASAVLEHIPSPGEMFSKLFSLMNEKSILYFRTPYRYPLHKLVSKFGINLDMLYPGHIWDFGGDAWWRRLPKLMDVDKEGVSVLTSRPSIVEKTFRTHFFVALISYLMKAPGFLFRGWKYSGGWEVVYIKQFNHSDD